MSATYKNREEYGKKAKNKFGTEYHYVFNLKTKKWSYFDYYGKEKTLQGITNGREKTKRYIKRI